jgi:hypothetical protein
MVWQVVNATTRSRLLCVLLFLIALVACVLNLDTLFVHDVQLWDRVAIRAGLLVGLAGVLQTNRVVSITTMVIAWASIGLFIILVIGTLIPGEMTRLAGYPPDQPPSLLIERFVLLMALGILIAFVFFKLSRLHANSVE